MRTHPNPLHPAVTPARPLRVAMVSETYSPEVNGVAMTVGRLVSGLRARGSAIDLVRPRQSDADRPADELGFHELLTPSLPIPNYPGLRFGLPAQNALLKNWQARRPDIVHVATEGPLGWSAVSAARRLGLPITSGFHTNFHAYSRHYGLGWLNGPIAAYLRHFHNRTHTTFVPTHRLAHELATAGYRNVAVLSRGIDIRLFNPARRSGPLRRQWGVGPDTPVVAHIGRLAPEKNIELVLFAFDAIRAARPDAKLLFVGDGPLRPTLQKRFPEHMFAGTRHGEPLATHYASADLFLFPSLTDTFGNVTVEALASGLGVVAYDCAAAADLIESGANGLTVPPGNEQAFIDAAVRLATDPGLLARLRLRAAPRVARLDWERIHDQFVGTLVDIVRTHARRQDAKGLFAVAPD